MTESVKQNVKLPKQPNLRQIIAMNVSAAIQGTREYKAMGVDDYYQNRANYVNMATDNIIRSFIAELPDYVDIGEKYEQGDISGVILDVSAGRSESWNQEQLNYLARYADDRGFNRAIYEIVDNIESIYETDRVKHHGDLHRDKGVDESNEI